LIAILALHRCDYGPTHKIPDTPRAIAKDLPPRSTLYDYFDLWNWDGTLDRIHDALYAQCRQAASREASPTAAIIDSQSVKSAEKDPMRVDGGLTW
jgi:transposase